MNLWAAERNLNSDIQQCFRLDPITDIEKNLPKDILITAFPAWFKISKRKPAEYDRLYFYVTNSETFNHWLNFKKERIRKTNPNIFALNTHDPHLIHTSQKGVVPIPQVYVDIYSINGPEAPPFLRDITSTFPILNPW